VGRQGSVWWFLVFGFWVNKVRVRGLEHQALRFGVKLIGGLGLRIEESGCRFWGSGLRV
jgi:hypothetical protein